MESLYLSFQDVSSKKKVTKDFRVNTKDGLILLGRIYWRSGWRRYVFEPVNSIFDSNCLKDVCSFLDELMKARKK